MKITKQEVVVFKGVHCNENCLVADILRERFSRTLVQPILDVGSGLGDISASAFPEKRVIHLDVLDYSNHPIPVNHSREKSDFFSYDPADQAIGTVLLCHVLQFLDDDISRLNEKVKELDPECVVVVDNANDYFMGELVEWFASNSKDANPEVNVPEFPAGYVLSEETRFTARLECKDFPTLAEQVCFLMDCALPVAKHQMLVKYLERQLDTPSFAINERVKLFRRQR
ncbi:hypothetical protein [Zoogloea sp.]|uniref:hypothetical protein n=1 Tax=Zoogloea sp. TaxID=49181 RepID=UPI001AD50DFB|nr:hypothetical protein [Zoogloea sp.]MBN8283080.1 hypothetical protein [Zoogloea sp.]